MMEPAESNTEAAVPYAKPLFTDESQKIEWPPLSHSRSVGDLARHGQAFKNLNSEILHPAMGVPAGHVALIRAMDPSRSAAG